MHFAGSVDMRVWWRAIQAAARKGAVLDAMVCWVGPVLAMFVPFDAIA
jgi:hypothetical protein